MPVLRDPTKQADPVWIVLMWYNCLVPKVQQRLKTNECLSGVWCDVKKLLTGDNRIRSSSLNLKSEQNGILCLTCIMFCS